MNTATLISLCVGLLCLALELFGIWRELYMLRTGTDVLQLLLERRRPKKERKYRL